MNFRESLWWSILGQAIRQNRVEGHFCLPLQNPQWCFSLQYLHLSSPRLTLEQQTAEVYKAIEDKMNTAAAQRDENIKKMLERLREHVSCSLVPSC